MNKKRPKLAKSIRSLAALVGRSESAVRKWVAHPEWRFSTTPPWDVARVKAWAEIVLHPDPAANFRKKAKAAEGGTGEFAELGPVGKLRCQLMIARIKRLLLDEQIARGKMHDTEQCQGRRLRQIHEVKGRLLELPSSIAHSLVGEDAAAIERILAEQIRTIIDDFAAGGAEGNDPPSAATPPEESHG